MLVPFVFWLASSSVLACPEVRPSPTATAAPDRAAVAAFIHEGNALHDRGDYDGAIRKYREALAADPQNGEVMYEIANSLQAKKDYAGALEMAKAAEKTPNPTRMLPVLVGNIHDLMGDPKAAIETYRAAISKDPDFFLLYFNLGIAYDSLGRHDLARTCLQISTALAPRHPGSHFQLGRIYREGGYRTPAILALARALSLEPGTVRSRQARDTIDALFRAGVERDAKGNTKITVDPDRPKDEGDFTVSEVMIPLISAAEKIVPAAGGTPNGPTSAERLVSLIASVGESASDRGHGFAADTYAAICAELVRDKLVEGYVALVLAGDDSSGMAAWRAQNQTAAKQAAALAGRFDWSKSRPALPPDSGKASAPKL